ncbi:hypothetical protein EVG20_g3201 [Dentipellis fragilis]|uniref:Uncharacterized protein n=1 Tax=Dentipellis fragilis TaxID=205917 RepID=A0A4Y9Z6A1_9AGAM|nr:hypothetical protein EVG20_g3201 [Dentipellis fragilis]
MPTSSSIPQSFELHDGCWMYGYDYTGPIPGFNDSGFSICAQFDHGSERYFSGFRIVVLCRKDEKEFAGLTVGVDRGQYGSCALDPGLSIQGTSRTVEDPQSAASAGDTPCTVVYEIVDKSDETWYAADIQLRPPQLVDDDAYRIVHEHKQLCTSAPSSKSVMLFLLASCSFRGQLKPSNPMGVVCALPAPVGVSARGVRILPPPALHPPFKQPPPEILHLIFLQALEDKLYEPWRSSLLSFTLVCRAWAPVFVMLYQDFSQYAGGRSPPKQVGLAAALRLNPERGRAIRRFSPYHFRSGDETYEELSQALVDILSSASLVEDLTIKDVFVDYKDKFIQALRGCTAVTSFMVNRGPPDPEKEPSTYVLSLADIITCMAHWRSLRILTIYGFNSSINSNGDNPTPICQLQQLRLQGGRASDLELMHITSSSLSSLRQVDFDKVTGITNSGLKEWLLAVAGTLKSLSFDDCTFSRENNDEEHAIDAAIGQMDQLRSLQLDGEMYTELVFMRKEKKPRPPGVRGRIYRIRLSSIRPGAFTKHFLSVLKYTGWEDINMWGAFDHEPELREEAKKVA